MKSQENGKPPVELSSKRESNWPFVMLYIQLHILALYGLWLALTDAKWTTVLFCFFLTMLGILGVNCGAHRLWAHRTYKANLPLRILLMLCQTLVGQGPIYDWVIDHRQHHAHYGTDGDPYNHNRGFFYSHVTAHMASLSPLQEKLRDEQDVTDLEDDKVIMFQKSFYYWILYPVLFVLLPINAPAEYWGENLLNAIFVIGFLRYALVLHAAWLVNSALHIWGLKPGDKYPADTNMVFILTKSYWPQYHYLMPWDYQSGEFGTYGKGCSTTFIRIWAAIGWATQLRTMSSDSVKLALTKSVNHTKPIEECLKEAEKLQSLPEDHYLVEKSL